MIKHLLLWLTAAALLVALDSNAQDTPRHVGCNVTADFYRSKSFGPSGHVEGLTMATAYPAKAKDTCGKIIVYYDDIRIALAGGVVDGFAHTSLGTTRRSTVCAMLTYIQSVFDFSKIPSGQFLRLSVAQSWMPSRPTPAAWIGRLGTGTPFYDSTGLKDGDTVNGFFHDFVTEGIDPTGLDNFHGEMAFNFDSVTLSNITKISSGKELRGQTWIPSQNYDLDSATGCEYDMYSYALHMMGHVMGMLNWQNISYHTELISKKFWSDFTLHITAGPDPYTPVYNPLAPGSLVPFNTPGALADYTYFWTNFKQSPYNYPVDEDDQNHLRTNGQNYRVRERISPGDMNAYAMQYATVLGETKRIYTKGDLDVFHDAMGYGYNPSFATAKAAVLANHIPWSSKMAYSYNAQLTDSGFGELNTADFSMTNNTGSSLVINIASDTSIHDDDGDVLSVYPGSLVNFRGCGQGGNNHNLLTLSSSDRTITYTPRPNFYGRAVFGFNLWDGVEKGAFVVYYVDVKKGSNVSVVKGTNMIQNGDQEEGEEVMIKGTAEHINNSYYHQSYYIGSRYGGNSPDGQFFANSTAIRNSYSECSNNHIPDFGAYEQSFPFPTPDGTVSTVWDQSKIVYPEHKGGAGNRYLTANHSALYYLNDTMRNCKRYIFECDIARTYLKTDPAHPYPAVDSLYLGFTTRDLATFPDATHLVQKYKAQPITGLITGVWVHIKIPLTYCSDTAATMMYLNLPSYKRDMAASYLMDNISLIELPDTAKLVVNISDSSAGACRRRLYSDVPDMACPMSFEWRKLDGTLIATTATTDIDATVGGTYTLKLADGCGRIARDTYVIASCPCMPGSVFGASVTRYDTLKGTVTGTLPSGYYYIASDITITGVTRWNKAKVLIEPGVQITVANTAKLTLDSSHLFVCPDTNLLWKGILLSGGPNTGRISVTGNTLIEDAITAIGLSAPVHPGSGDSLIHTNGAIFNRCINGISIDNDTAFTPVYPYKISNAVFTSRQLKTFAGYPNTWPTTAQLKDVYANTNATPPVKADRDFAMVNTKNGLPAYAGIRLNKVGKRAGSVYYEIRIGKAADMVSRNLFDNTGDGIYATSTNLRSLNNCFIRMKKFVPGPGSSAGTVWPSPTGTGIYAFGAGRGNSLIADYDFAVNADLPNYFYDCQTGIRATDNLITKAIKCYVQTSNTDPKSTMTGFDMGAAYYDTLSLTRNVFYNVPTGILFYPNSSSPGYRLGDAHIDDNSFDAHPLSPVVSSAAHFIRQGIKVNSSITSMTGAVNSRLNILDNTMSNVFNGIAVSYMRKQWAVSNNNNITMAADPSGAVQYGISYSGCYTGIIRFNNVSTTTATSDKVRGYYLSANTGTMMQCNTATNTGRGFDFIGTQPATDWWGGIMDGNLKGLALGGPIDPQSSITKSCWAQWMLPGGWSATSGRYQTYTYSPSISSPLWQNPIMWTDRTGRPTINFGSLPSDQYSTSLGSLKNPQVWGFDPCVQYYPAFPAPKPPTSPTATATLDATMTFPRFAPESRWLAQHNLWQALSIDSVFNDTLRLGLPAFMQSAGNSRYKWLTDIENALAEKDLVTASALLGSPITGSGWQNIAPDLVITDDASGDPIVNNYVMYYNLYRDYLANDTLADSTTLDYLSRLCPLANGAVVYQARALFSKVYGDPGTYDDDDLCGVPYSQGGYQYKMAAVAPSDSKLLIQAYELFPNPNSGIFTLRQLTRDDQPATVTVYDALGRQVSRQTVSFKQGPVIVQSGSVLPGLYMVCVRDHTGNNWCSKFTVNKN